MRTIINKLALIAATLIISAIPILADDGMINPANEPALEGGKNECLLVAMNCTGEVDSLRNKIDRIQKEIDRGSNVYNNEELNILRNKLDEATRAAEEAYGPGGV